MVIKELFSITVTLLITFAGWLVSWPLVIYLMTTDYKYIALIYLSFFVLGEYVND